MITGMTEDQVFAAWQSERRTPWWPVTLHNMRQDRDEPVHMEPAFEVKQESASSPSNAQDVTPTLTTQRPY